MAKKIWFTIIFLLFNSQVALAANGIQKVNVFNKDIGIVLGIVLITLVVTMAGFLVELWNQAKVKLYLQLILGASILITVFGYFSVLVAKLFSVANGVF